MWLSSAELGEEGFEGFQTQKWKLGLKFKDKTSWLGTEPGDS